MSRHAPYYCEENIWWLAQEPAFATTPLHVIFISNTRRAVAMLHQRAARPPGVPIVWDYHVVLAAGDGAWTEVWDLDCTDGAPLLGRAWLTLSFGGDRPLPAPFRPRFRVVAAAEFVASFASDRSHMRTRDGRYRVAPPPWPCIGAGTNLERFVDFGDATFGEIVDLDTLRGRWR